MNEDITNTVKALAKHKFIEPQGLATRSTAARGRERLRIEDEKSDVAPCEFPDAGSSQLPP